MAYLTLIPRCEFKKKYKIRVKSFCKYRYHCVQQNTERLQIKTIHDHRTWGQIQDFKLGGAHLKKLHRAEGSAKNVGVFRVKNHDFTPKNHIFSNCGGRRENFWGISCEKNNDFTPKNHIFSNFRGGGRWVRPPLDPPLGLSYDNNKNTRQINIV